MKNQNIFKMNLDLEQFSKPPEYYKFIENDSISMPPDLESIQKINSKYYSFGEILNVLMNIIKNTLIY